LNTALLRRHKMSDCINCRYLKTSGLGAVCVRAQIMRQIFADEWSPEFATRMWGVRHRPPIHACHAPKEVQDEGM